MTEEQLVDQITEQADSFGLLWHHCPDSRWCNGSRGFPDLLIAGRRGLLVPEVKLPHKTLSPGQVTWKYTLLASGQPWQLWQPGDWDSGQIHAELRSIA